MKRVVRRHLTGALVAAVAVASPALGNPAFAADNAAAPSSVAVSNASTTRPYELVVDGNFKNVRSLAGSPWVVIKSDKSMSCGIVDDGTGTPGGDSGDAFHVYNPKQTAAGYCILSQNLAVDVPANGSFLTRVLPRAVGTDVSCQLTTPDSGLIQLAEGRDLAANYSAALASQVSLASAGAYNIACSYTCEAGAAIRVDDISLTASTGGAPSTGPSTSSGITSLGCRTEGRNRRALVGAATAADDMSVEHCASFCSDWKYFGLEYGRECYCGEYFHRSSDAAPDSDCDLPCAGNSTQTCGGFDRLNAYHNVGVPGPVEAGSVATQQGNSTYYGCYTETGGAGGFGRTLSAAGFASDRLSLEVCEDFCVQSGNSIRGRAFAFWGVEYGRECYCDDALSGNSIQIGDTECEMSICGGNPAQSCGGPLRLAAYQYNGMA